MKHQFLVICSTMSLWLALNEASIAQTSPNSMLYSPNVNLSSGSQNGFVGTVGGIFLTTYSFYPQVNWLGYYDQNGDGLANSHVVTLWDNSNQSVIASATVPAGTAATMLLVRKRTASIFGETLFPTMLPTMVTTDRSPGIPNTFNLVQDGNSVGRGGTILRPTTPESRQTR